MNTPNFDNRAAQAATQAALDNAGSAIDTVLAKSTALLERNVAAAKATVERHTAYANELRGLRDVNDIAAAQERISKAEAAAIEDFSRDIYALSNEATTELAELNERNRTAATDLVTDSFEQVVKAIPGGFANPYGEFMRNVLRAQMEAGKSCQDMLDKTIAAQRAQLASLADAMSAAGAAATGTAKRGK